MLRSFGDYICAYSIGRAGVLALAYFSAAEFGHLISLKTQDQAFATCWPPAGLLLATLVRTQYRLWPAMLLAACTANLASDVLLHDKSVPVSLGFCAANCSEACIGGWLLRRFVGLPFTVTRIKDVLALACLSALVSTMFGATVGAGVVKLAFHAAYWQTWQVWWASDALGVIVVAPVVFLGTADRAAAFQGIRPWRVVECAVLFLGLMLVVEGVFGEWLPWGMAPPMLFMPFLLWAVLRFRPTVAASALLVIVVIALWNTTQGRGPYTFLSSVPSERIVRAQTALSVMCLSVLLLAAVVAERQQAEQEKLKLIGELEQALTEIKTLRGLIPICGWCKKIRDDQGFWQQLEVYLRAQTSAEFTHGICPECLEKQFAALEGGRLDRTGS